MRETVNHCVDALALWRLQDWLHAHPRVVVIGGAGCSTEVGIPDYRDRNGQWKRPQPVTYQAFMGDALVRQRYWARSMLGWRVMGQAQPVPPSGAGAAGAARPAGVADYPERRWPA